ncbi:MAG: hypothetical protein P1P87_10945, partial [Trueperaceae bacterium]|nr:hypothetical protein [Trueperaceae bacterium]
MAVDVTVPSVGESITEVFVGTWLKKPGEAVAKDEPLVEIETDKATNEVPSPHTGTVKEIRVRAGDVAEVGDVIMVFEVEWEAEPEKPAGEPEEQREEPEGAGALAHAADRYLRDFVVDIRETGPADADPCLPRDYLANWYIIHT